MVMQEAFPEMRQHPVTTTVPSSPSSLSPSIGSEKTLVAVRPSTSPRFVASTANTSEDAAHKRPVVPKLAISFGAIASFLVITLATSIYIASIPGIMAEFRIERTLAILPVTLYALGFVVGPVCTSALSEEFGRQYIYKGALFLHAAFTIGGALARNFRTIAVCRAMSGLAGSPSVSVFAGVLNDLWRMPEDKLAVPLFLLYGLSGATAPTIGPVVGESVVAAFGWRSSFWLTAILVGACFIAMLFVPETFEPELQRRRLKRPRRALREALTPTLKRPFQLLFSEPIIFPTAAVVTLSQVNVFIFYAGFPVVLRRTYGFTPYQTGLAFLSLLVGTLLAVPVLFVVERRKRTLDRPTPEDSLPGAKVAAILLPVGLILIGWTTRPSIHWVWPLLAGAIYGMGFAPSQLVYPVYKNQIYGAELGVSSMAVDVAMRYSVSPVFPLFTVQLIESIGFDWTMTACAMFMAALAPVPWVLCKKGPSLRAQSKYAESFPVERRTTTKPVQMTAGSGSLA